MSRPSLRGDAFLLGLTLCFVVALLSAAVILSWSWR